MQTQKLELSDIAYFTVNFEAHIYPVLGYLFDLEAQGMKYDVYGPKVLLEKIFKSPQRNCFHFEELEWKEDEQEDLKGLFKAALEGFSRTISKVEDIWKNRGKKPKLIIADFCAPYAQYLAKKHGIPHIVLYHIFFFNESMWEQLKDFNQSINFSMNQSLHLLADQVEDEYGVSIKSIADFSIVGDKTVSFLPKFLGDAINPSNENSYYIGPTTRCELNYDKICDFDNTILESNNIIYVTLGKAVMTAARLATFKNIIESFKDTEHKVLISNLEKTEELTANGLPDNIIIKNWSPQSKVLEHSKLFISHVGAKSLTDALEKGVPIIALPNLGDQFILAKAMVKLNVGRYVEDRSPSNIRKVVEDVLKDESIRANCKKYKEMFDLEASKNQFRAIIKNMLK